MATTTTTKVAHEETKSSSASRLTTGSDSTTASAAASGKSYQARDRDVVIVGDDDEDKTDAKSRLANRLLSDFCCVHRQLGSSASKGNTAKRLVRLMQDGVPSSLFLRGSGKFVKIAPGASRIAEPREASKFCESLMEDDATKPTDAETIKVEKPQAASAKSKHCQPGEYDVKICSNTINPEEDFSKHNGNLRFQDLLEKHTAGDSVNTDVSSSVRVKAALETLRETEKLSDTRTARFMMRTNDEKAWVVLEKAEAAEFVVACVFDRLLDLPAASAATDIKALIPSIGDAEISQFSQFLEPGTTPIQEPSEFDVLFGRGGMTNSHPGNKRFRDIISLHRPDYVRAIKVEKPNVARRIVAAIRGGNPPGRFMKRNPTNLMWYDVGNRHATEKTSQALREKSQAEKNGAVVVTEGDARKRLLEQALYEARVTKMRLSKEGADQIGNGALDPNTFQLLVPKQYVASTSNGKGSSNSSASGEKSSDKPLPRVNLPLDLKDIKMTDAGASSSISPSASVGVLDQNGDVLVTENDILCGRGGLTNHHKGNKRFRDIVALHRPDYVRAAKVHKPAVARLIVKAIRNSDPPGRFLKKDDSTGKWYDIGDKRAAEKASQALREKSPDERNQSEKSGSSSSEKSLERSSDAPKPDISTTRHGDSDNNGEEKRTENGDGQGRDVFKQAGKTRNGKKKDSTAATESANDLKDNPLRIDVATV